MQNFASHNNTNLGGEYCEDELARVECVEDVGDHAEIGGCGDVGLEADITELWFRSDVDSDILPQTIVIIILEILTFT